MTKSDQTSKPEMDVRAVVRALSIFDAFDREQPSLSLQEISERIAMPKATTFRLVNTVWRAGYLVRLPDQRYSLSGKFSRLSGLVRSTLSIRDVALPVMSEANRISGETITLNVGTSAERVCLEVVDTPAPLMAIVRPGEHVPILHGATGKILLAFMSPEDLADTLKIADAESVLDLKALDLELRRYRSQGYALTRGQRIKGVTAIAVPITPARPGPRYCLALTGPSVRVDPRESEFVELMVSAGQQVSSMLG